MGLDRGGRIISPEFGFTGWGDGAFDATGTADDSTMESRWRCAGRVESLPFGTIEANDEVDIGDLCMHRTLNLLRRPLAVAMVIAALASPALSEDFTESHIAAARETIAAAHASEQFNEILLALADQTKALFQRSNPGAAKDIEEVVGSVALDLAKRRPDLDRELERVWAGRFSEDELKQITAFFKSPVGEKYGQMAPVIIQDSMRSAGIWRDAISTEIVTRSRDELNKRGYNF